MLMSSDLKSIFHRLACMRPVHYFIFLFPTDTAEEWISEPTVRLWYTTQMAISFIMGPIFPCLAVYSFSIA